MSAPPSIPTGLTHACARCGAPVPLEVGLCERCNPIGLRDAASSQVHGTVFLGIGTAVIALWLVAQAAVNGIGPFPAAVAGIRAADEGAALVVTLRVSNSGSRLGSTTCRVSDPGIPGGQAVFVQSPRIEPGAVLTFDATVVGLGTAVRPLAVECSNP